MARKAISVQDENGMLSFPLGARPVPWSEMDESLAEYVAYDELTTDVSYETLMGWDGGWTFGILINDEVVCFVDGDEPPATVAGLPLIGYPEEQTA